MNKENNRSAAGLRRSAIAERIRLREEWSALKGMQTNKSTNRQTASVSKTNVTNAAEGKGIGNKENVEHVALTSDVLQGIVALVEVGGGSRALALRAALGALGASVEPTWRPTVTHLIWAQGGCRSVRARARALACRLVSPLWVEACAAAGGRLPESAFPAAARASDLPSPRTLRQLLKKAERENIPLQALLTDSKEEEKEKPLRLRMSSETENDTSAERDTSRDTSGDTTAPESRVNTAPRRALPVSITPEPRRSRRKLFTQKITDGTECQTEEETPAAKPLKPAKITHQERRELARAERIAKRLVAACNPNAGKKDVPINASKPRIVLTGMSKSERQIACNAIKSLQGRLQSRVNKHTTHVLLGSCSEDSNVTCDKITGVTRLDNVTGLNNVTQMNNNVIKVSDVPKARTVNALIGAARGCKVLYGQWIVDCMEAKKWLHHCGYEVPHLKKISQKARVERNALNCLNSDYSYDVFNGMRVHLTPAAENRDAAVQLLNLCGAVVVEQLVNPRQRNAEGIKDGVGTQNGGRTQNGGQTQNGGRTQYGVGTQIGRQNTFSNEVDVVIGVKNGEVASKWVFDSVAAGRMRTTRRYVLNELSSSQIM